MTKKEETKDNSFDLQEALKGVKMSRMLKKGFEYYITKNNISIKNEKELNKTIKDFKKIKIGE